jgi:hypothetical protein
MNQILKLKNLERLYSLIEQGHKAAYENNLDEVDHNLRNAMQIIEAMKALL